MPLNIQPKTFKQQAKLLVKHWPLGQIKLARAQDFLCQLYGFKHYHHFQQCCRSNETFEPLHSVIVVSCYPLWVQQLADLGSINQIQAKKLLHLLWPRYLSEQAPLHQKLYECNFSIHGACRDLLPASVSNPEGIHYPFDDRPAVFDALQALGIPHVEIAAIKVNNHWRDWSYQLQHRDSIEVFSYKDKPERYIKPMMPNREPVWMLDVHLGALARYLRMAGFNTWFQQEDLGDETLAKVAAKERRILLSRDIGWLKRRLVPYGRWIRATDPQEQFREVIRAYELQDRIQPFTRCTQCNDLLKMVDKPSIKTRVPARVYEQYYQFKACPSCDKVYWPGTHINKMNDLLSSVHVQERDD